MHALCMQTGPSRNHCCLTVATVTTHLSLRRMRRAFGLFTSLILLAPVGADGSEGGGGAGGGGGGSNNPSGAGEPGNTGLTEQSVQKLIDKAINGRNQQLLAQLEAKQTKSAEDLKSSLTETFGTLLTEALAQRGDDPDKGGKGKQTPAPADVTSSPEYKKLAKRLEDQEKKTEAAELERTRERDAKKETDFNRTVEAELTKLGVQDPEGARILLSARGRVKRRDDDSIVVTDGKDSEDDLTDGLTEWTRSAEGKRFMPATGASGSGARPDRGSGARGGNGDGKASTSELGQALSRELGVPIL